MDINTIGISSVQMHLDKIKSKFKTYIDITLSETKVPFKVSVFKTSTSWRISELVACAIENYKNNQNISSAILTRAAMESTAALWYLRQNIVEALERKDIEKFDRIIMRMLLGWGKSKDKMDFDQESLSKINKRIHVNEFIESVGDDFETSYDRLCEFSHPNYLGNYQSYSKKYFGNYGVHFGPSTSNTQPIQNLIIMSLEGSLHLFDASDIEDIMPDFIYLCDSQGAAD